MSKKRSSDAKSNLQKLSHERLDIGQMHNSLSAAKKGDDRTLAIVGGALIDVALEQGLRHHLEKLGVVEEKMFAAFGVFSTTASKIQIALATGLVNKRAASDLVWANDIRNAFAHSAPETTFDTPAIAAACQELSLVSKQDLIDESAIFAEVATPDDREPGYTLIDRTGFIGFRGEFGNEAKAYDRFVGCLSILWFLLMSPQFGPLERQ
ncbi:hypothetical protein [Ensifer soli]|uniref:hypothetical protein n=1 Tax=Ciceribacter sp. sgz301302 TaxID=3342379 RepID=UPI0035B7F346